MTTCFDTHIGVQNSPFTDGELDAVFRLKSSFAKQYPDFKEGTHEYFALDKLYSETEMKITSGFTNTFKSPEGTLPQERTKLADHVKQGISTFLNTGVDLFSFVTNKNNKEEIAQRFATFIGKNRLSEAERLTSDHFADFMRFHVRGAFKTSGFLPNNTLIKVSDNERAQALIGADLFHQLTYVEGGKRVTTEAVMAAIGYASYQALFDLDASTQFKSLKDIESIHGRTVKDRKAFTVLKNKHLPVGTAINSWGEYAYQALGLSAIPGSSPDMVAKLKVALGGKVAQVLRDRNILRVEHLAPEDYNALFVSVDEIVTQEGETEAAQQTAQGETVSGTNRVHFYTVNDKYFAKDKLSPVDVKRLIEGAITARKQSQSLIQKVFTNTTNTKDILYTPTTEITEKTKTGMQVPGLMKKAQEVVQNQPLMAEPVQGNLLVGMANSYIADGYSFAEALVGIKPEEEINKAHHTQRDGLHAANEALKTGLETLLQHFKDIETANEDTPGTTLPVFLKMDVWKMLRAGTTASAIDPTSNKIHRYSMVYPDWVSKVDFTEVGKVNDFLRRVAEGLNIATDKQSNLITDQEFADTISQSVFGKAIEAIQNQDELGYQSILNAIDSAGLKGAERVKTFSALVAYANYKTAKDSGATSFESSLIGEIDGVSNGPMLTMLLFGLTGGAMSMEDMFSKGGFYTNDNKDFNVYRGEGNIDFYEHVNKAVLESVGNWAAANQGPYLDALHYFANPKQKDADLFNRKTIKDAVNPITFGSATYGAIRGLFNGTIDRMYARIAEVHSMPRDAEFDAALAELNTQLDGLGFKPEKTDIEYLHNTFELTSTQIDAAFKSYNAKGSIGPVIAQSLETYFGAFMEVRNLIENSTNNAANNYLEIKNRLIQEELNKLGVSYEEGAINVGLSKEQLEAIDTRLKELGITPIMDSIWSQEEGNLDAGLLLLKKFNGSSDKEVYKTKVTGSVPFLSGESRHMTGRAKETMEIAPGKLGASVGTHSFDGNISFKSMLDMFEKGVNSFNMHDSRGTSFAYLKEMGIALNKNTLHGLITYSPLTSIAEMAIRNLEGVLKSGTTAVDVRTLITQAGSVGSLINAARVGTANKLNFLKDVKNVSQYAYEGGSYEVTAKDLKAIEEADKKETDRHAELLAKLNAINEALVKKLEAETPTAEIKPTETTLDPLQTKLNSLGLDDEVSLDTFLDIVSNSKYAAYAELAKVLKGTKAKVRVINDVFDIKDVTARDAITALGDFEGAFYNDVIYIKKANILLENLEETMLHESIHAVITGWLLEDKNKETEVYKNIQELYEIAKTAVKEQNQEFVEEVANIDEFVTYALTRKSFQDFLNTLTISSEIKKYYTNNVFLNFMQKVAEIFNSALKFTKNNKVDLRQTKTLNNVLLAVVSQGAVLIDLAKKERQSSNVARGMRLSNGLYTHRTMDVFDALNTGNTNTTNTNHLRNLLSTVVYRLHGPFGSLHAKYMKDTPIDEVGTYQAAYKAGDLPIATAIATANLPMSDAEAFAVDQVAIALEGGLNNPAMRKYRRVLELMYEQAQKELKPTDFSKGVYDFIFDTANTNQQSLVRFAALGLANQEVMEAFKKVNVFLPDVKVKNTLFSRLQWLFTQVMSFVSSKATGVRQGVSLDQNLEHILKNLIASEAKYQAIAAKPVTESALAKYTKEGMKQLGKGITKVATSQAVQNSSVKKVPVVGNLAAYMLKTVGTVTDVTVNGRIEEHVEGAMKLRNALHDGPLGFRAGILNEMRGETTIKSKFFRLLQLVKDTEQKRETYIQQRASNIMEMFVQGGQNLTKEQKHSITDLLRTGVGVVGFTGAQIKELLSDSTKLDKEIADTIAKIKPIAKKHTNFIAGKAEATGAWLQTGVSQDPTRIAMNATMVIAMQGTPVEGQLKKEKDVLLPEVEKLISLFGLQHMNKSVLKTVLDTEVSRGADNGIDFALRLHNTLHKEAKERLFKGKDVLMQHGYLPEVVNPNVDVKYVTATPNKTLDENVAMYQKAGYVSYGLMTRDPAHTVPTVMLVNKNVPATRRLTALMAVIDDNTKGTLMHDGDNTGPFAKANQVMNGRLNKVTALNYAKWEKQGFSFSKDYENTLMVPLVNEKGELVNARYMATSNFRNNVLTRNNDFAYLLGKYEGTTYEKVTSKEQNKTIVQATKDLFDVNYAKNKRDYFYVGKSSTNKEYKEAYLLLPNETKQEIKRVWGDDGMFVRKDMLDLVFGYRKLTVGDAMLKSKTEQALTIKGMNSLVEYLYARNGSNDEKYAARLKAANFMKVLQRGTEEVVTEVKKSIVMRLPLVLVGNETSNMTMLKLKGMGVFEALQEKGKALAALNVYRSQSEELDKLNTYLRTGTRINEHPVFIKRVAWLEESMNKNPVKPLIDAGFMPTIVEDVETIAEDYSYKGELLNKIDVAANKFKPLKAVVGASNQMYMGEDTGLFQFMRFATQASDFTARYALYVHLSKDKTKPQSEIFKELSESFVNYDAPSHRMMEALNSVGLLMFTKFVLRIQKPLFEAIKENPSNAMLLWLFNSFFDGLTVITESSFVNRFYNPLKLGPLEFPFILDDLATVSAITNTVGLIPE